MYKKWTIADIEDVILELNKKLEYKCRLKIEVSKRATRRLGAFFYKKGENSIEPIKFVFAECLLNGTYNEKIVREVIIHEYLHYYCDTKTGVSNGHNSFFKKMCRDMNISERATLKQESDTNKKIEYKYNIYCSSCNKFICGHKRKDFAHNKVKKYISSCCKAKLAIK